MMTDLIGTRVRQVKGEPEQTILEGTIRGSMCTHEEGPSFLVQPDGSVKLIECKWFEVRLLSESESSQAQFTLNEIRTFLTRVIVTTPNNTNVNAYDMLALLNGKKPDMDVSRTTWLGKVSPKVMAKKLDKITKLVPDWWEPGRMSGTIIDANEILSILDD